MVQVEIKFKDGSRIYNKSSYRCIEYSYGEYEGNAGKYYYLKRLQEYRDIAQIVFNDLKTIHDMTTGSYNKDVVVKICNMVRNNPVYEQGDEAFFTVIYLAMVDLESEKKMPNWPGKALVLNSCRAVLLDNMHYEEAANLGTKYYAPENHIINDDEPF